MIRTANLRGGINCIQDLPCRRVSSIGSPTIPEVLHLSAADDLFAWRSDYYGDSLDATDALWTKVKEEIVANRLERAPDANCESVLYNHRPLLEDGEIECDFLYEAGETEIHPARDCAALLIAPEGVKLHYLTDGTYIARD